MNAALRLGVIAAVVAGSAGTPQRAAISGPAPSIPAAAVSSTPSTTPAAPSAVTPAASPAPPAAPAQATPPSPPSATFPAAELTVAPHASNIPSLMFTPDEVQAVEKAYSDHMRPEVAAAQARTAGAAQQGRAEAEHPRVPNIYVSAVLDLGDGDWTVWANGLRITPGHQPPLFEIVAVEGNTVEIAPKILASGHIRLQPNQTWRSSEGDVVEGIVP